MFALRQNASGFSLHVLTWLKEMLTVRERTSPGFSAGGDRIQKENADDGEFAVNKAPWLARAAKIPRQQRQSGLNCNHNDRPAAKIKRQALGVSLLSRP